jgi:ADP-ribose pyrophosphatase YjhB (NUDIX family)
MHRLQSHILSQLILNPERRYADLKPAEVEGNLFMYHLKTLIKQDLVVKGSDGLYRLTLEGKRYADGLSLKTFKPRAQPRIVTLLVIRQGDGQYLFLRRKRQPLLGKVGFPYGKVHLDESIADAAARELHEKTGLTADLSHRGDGYITIYEQAEPVSQIMFHLFYGEEPMGELTAETSVGSAFWAGLESIDETYMPSVRGLLAELAQSGDERFFVELSYR